MEVGRPVARGVVGVGGRAGRGDTARGIWAGSGSGTAGMALSVWLGRRDPALAIRVGDMGYSVGPLSGGGVGYASFDRAESGDPL